MKVLKTEKEDRSNYLNRTNRRKSMARLVSRQKRVMNETFVICLLEKVDVFILNRGKKQIYDRHL